MLIVWYSPSATDSLDLPDIKSYQLTAHLKYIVVRVKQTYKKYSFLIN